MVLMQCMQRTHSLLSMESLEPSQLHAVAGAEIHNFLLDVELAPVAAGMGARIGLEFTADIPLHGFLDRF